MPWNKDKTSSDDLRILKGSKKSQESRILNGTIPRGEKHHFFGKNKYNSAWARNSSERMKNGGAIKALSGVIKPTSYEKKISELCIENNLPFVYTGTGTFLIGGKNPDFVNMEKKIAIEVYSRYFKERFYGSCEEYEKQRAAYFRDHGFQTIFINEDEIEDDNWKEICLNKIHFFWGGVSGRPVPLFFNK